MKLQIRTATVADIDALVALSRRTIVESYTPFLGNDAVVAYIHSGAVDQYVADSIERCSVIVQDGEVAGYAVTSGNLIDLMMIDSARHRRGLGARLLRHVEDMLFQKHESLTLESFRENAPANAFYRKHGWVESRSYSCDQSGAEKIEFRKQK